MRGRGEGGMRGRGEGGMRGRGEGGMRGRGEGGMRGRGEGGMRGRGEGGMRGRGEGGMRGRGENVIHTTPFCVQSIPSNGNTCPATSDLESHVRTYTMPHPSQPHPPCDGTIYVRHHYLVSVMPQVHSAVCLGSALKATSHDIT